MYDELESSKSPKSPLLISECSFKQSAGGTEDYDNEP